MASPQSTDAIARFNFQQRLTQYPHFTGPQLLISPDEKLSGGDATLLVVRKQLLNDFIALVFPHPLKLLVTAIAAAPLAVCSFFLITITSIPAAAAAALVSVSLVLIGSIVIATAFWHRRTTYDAYQLLVMKVEELNDYDAKDGVRWSLVAEDRGGAVLRVYRVSQAYTKLKD
ncbi:hypothetical protein HDU77_004277 [Chytriomyces hyalinus]|nr:hypothetical protein HDU77_004277 [Chytriomyces hyalinus]